MTDYHTTYKGPEGQTTQWEDIQIKLGNMAPKPKKAPAAKYEGEQETVQDSKWLSGRDEDELGEVEDHFTDDRLLESIRYSASYCQLSSKSTPQIWTSIAAIAYRGCSLGMNTSYCMLFRQQRLKELKHAANTPLQGRLEFIRSTDFRQAVTQASESKWVVVTLYKDKCVPLLEALPHTALDA